MISIIVCSVSDQWREQLHENIKQNIGCDFEFLYIDNRIEKKGLCEVYNILAEQAKGEYLCFVHEDVIIDTPDWGTILVAKAAEKMTGAIGFAGAGTIIGGFPYWDDNCGTLARHYIQRDRVRESFLYDYRQKDATTDYRRVAVLDGMFLFCRKEIWLKNHFDNQTFDRFHLYDIDFTFSVSQRYINYVCMAVSISHFSTGGVSKEYYDTLVKFHNKWKTKFPYTIDKTAYEQKGKENHKLNIRRVVFEQVRWAKLSNREIISYLKNVDAVSSPYHYLVMIYSIIRERVVAFIKAIK